MKNIFFVAVTLIVVFIGCSGSATEQPEGSYYGVLPCADCPGVSYEIAFTTDSTYIEKRFHHDSDEEILTHEGTYRLDGEGIITLSGASAAEISSHLLLKNDTLKMLDSSKDLIPGNKENSYMLTKEKPEDFTMNESKSDK